MLPDATHSFQQTLTTCYHSFSQTSDFTLKHSLERLDIKAEMNDDTIINLEMQVSFTLVNS
jgi:hypothetical protein